MLSMIPKLKPFLKSCALVSGLVLLYACDAVEHDVTPGGPDVDVVGTEVVILSNGSAYIDLYSKIKTRSAIRLDIDSQPRKGNLSELGTGFLRYSPDQHFVKGRDAFAFSVYDENNRLLISDSLVIIVKDDTTGLPCGIYAREDFVYQATAAPVFVNVLANDILCGDSANLVLEIYRPNYEFPPHAGTATVLSNHTIRYTPGSNFSGSDEFIYKVSSPFDSSLVGFAIVHISSQDSCNFEVNDDYYSFDADSLIADTAASHGVVRLFVLNNDILCDSSSTEYSFSIVEFPDRGTAYYESADAIGYIFPQNAIPEPGYTDSLVYRVCIDQRCRYGKARIYVR